jgi:multiple sugar transport system substrate-binding protein
MEDYQIYRKLPNIYDVVWLGQKYFNEAMEGKTGIRDALKAWQEEGDALLLQMKENPDTSSFNRGGSDVIAVPAG